MLPIHVRPSEAKRLGSTRVEGGAESSGLFPAPPPHRLSLPLNGSCHGRQIHVDPPGSLLKPRLVTGDPDTLPPRPRAAMDLRRGDKGIQRTLGSSLLLADSLA